MPLRIDSSRAVGADLELTLGGLTPVVRDCEIRADGLWCGSVTLEVAPVVSVLAYDSEGCARSVRIERAAGADGALVRDCRVTVDGHEVDATHFRLILMAGRPSRFTLRKGEAPIALAREASPC